MAATAEELEQVNEVGPKVAQAILEFFAEDRNRELVQQLQKAGVDHDCREARHHDRSSKA